MWKQFLKTSWKQSPDGKIARIVGPKIRPHFSFFLDTIMPKMYTCFYTWLCPALRSPHCAVFYFAAFFPSGLLSRAFSRLVCFTVFSTQIKIFLVCLQWERYVFGMLTVIVLSKKIIWVNDRTVLASVLADNGHQSKRHCRSRFLNIWNFCFQILLVIK